MAGYNEIRGLRVKYLSADPAGAEDGQVWYNSTTGNLRVQGIGVASTSSSANMTNKRSLYGFGVGTGTAGLVVGGLDDSAGTAGTQTAAIAYCGRVPGSPAPGSPAETYNYDGSSWTSGNSFPTGGNSMQGIGAVNTAVVSTQAYDSTAMHHWNGTSWTAANARNTAKGGQAAFGTQTAAVLAGGFPSESNITEVYNGTNWTSGNTMNTGRNQIAGSGTQTDGLAFGGDRPPSEAAQTTIESWDGTSWATSPATLATARTRAGTGRNTASGTWIAGGIGPGGGGEAFDATEEFNFSTNTFTAAAWASGGNTNTALGTTAGNGLQTAAIIMGGADTLNNSELYNGSSWTAAPTLNTGRYGAGEATQAAQTAALLFGGVVTSTRKSETEEWNGSSWSEVNDMPADISQLAGAGTQTAALSIGGSTSGGNNAESYEYDGTDWSAGGNMNTARERAAAFGTQTAAVAVGGSPPNVNNVEEYNGTAWTAVNVYPTNITLASAAGILTAGLVFSGSIPPTTGNTNGYDGTSWSTRASMATARQGGAGAGTSTSALMASGANSGGTAVTTTEEFTGETTAAAPASNITTS